MIYYSAINIKPLKRTFLIAKNENGVCRISFTSDVKKFVKELKVYFSDEVTKSRSKLSKEVKQIQEYFAGKRKEFSMKVFLKGTKLQTNTWIGISKIPFGKTISYSELAKLSKNPKAIRAAAGACGKNPVPIVIPCHRVIAKDGSIGGFGGGIELKKKMLKLEK